MAHRVVQGAMTKSMPLRIKLNSSLSVLKHISWISLPADPFSITRGSSISKEDQPIALLMRFAECYPGYQEDMQIAFLKNFALSSPGSARVQPVSFLSEIPLLNHLHQGGIVYPRTLACVKFPVCSQVELGEAMYHEHSSRVVTPGLKLLEQPPHRRWRHLFSKLQRAQ